MTIAASALVVLFVPMFLIGLAIVVESGWSPLYSQKRAGLYGSWFTMWKFRTMTRHADRLRADLADLNEAPFPAFKIRRDPRVTRVGSLLRRSSLDELPQFWNVIRSEMSVVGPRPFPTEESAQLSPNALRRLEARPGITCTWQVESRHAAGAPLDDWLKKDLDYIELWTLRRDVILMGRTILAVLRLTGT